MGFGIWSVNGRNLSPRPAARMTAWIGIPPHFSQYTNSICMFADRISECELVMAAEVLKIGEIDFDEIIEKAASIILDGGLVVYPTDTSYGLGCDPQQQDALERLIAAKKRDPGYGVPLLFSDFSQCEVYHDFFDLERILAKLFWPGLLTLVVTPKKEVPDYVTGGRDSLAIRVPGHDVPRAIAKKSDTPIVGTSANISGGPTPFELPVAKEQLGDSVDLYIDAGISSASANSTIIGVIIEETQGHIKVYREGELTIEQLTESLRVDSDALRLWTTRIIQADM